MDLNKLKAVSMQKSKPVKSNMQGTEEYKTAIIGISGQIGPAHNTEEFWELITSGCDMVRDFPVDRLENAEKLFKKKYFKELPDNLGQCAYMDCIDTFDAELFQIAPIEAEYMDPVQRIMLESVWTTIEDAGYGGDKLRGSRTGVYIGYSSPNVQYSEVVEDADLYTAGVAVSGNVNSIIASRISYLLDLQGPAMIVDTACSSSLLAVQLACEQLRNGEIDTAIAGGIRIMMLPRIREGNSIGIESSTERTRTFDKSADGTGGGEGVVSLLLKPYKQAKKDKDHIYAVIRGCSSNQDGSSVGITAPNASAQEKVIRSAWKSAGIDPETVSYIEAHGTGTKLGDPIEITGIQQAFRKYTDKKQFCAIGSVKSNIGHLDCAAGLAGLLKVVLMLNKKQIPPTLHFVSPNKEINFIQSPVYIEDKLKDWEPGKDGIRRAGISSFGMSGTNCHMILEEEPDSTLQNSENEINLLCISGKNEKATKELLAAYVGYLKKHPQVDWKAFCYTANTGRGHYQYRIAVVADSVDNFLQMADHLEHSKTVLYGRNRIEEKKTEDEAGVITRKEWKELSEKATKLYQELQVKKETGERDKKLLQLARYYIDGATIQWKTVKDSEYKISIPTYVFQHKHYWHEMQERDIAIRKTKKLHPLVHEVLADTYDRRIYQTILSNENCWELKEHIINNVHVLPGTALIEIAHFAVADYLGTDAFALENLVYMVPLSCEENQQVILHTVVSEEGEELYVRARSRNSQGVWTPHIELKVRQEKTIITKQVESVGEIRKRCKPVDITRSEENNNSIVQIESTRWNNISSAFANENELLLEFKMKEELQKDSAHYYLYPSLLDPAINSGNYLLKETYLPFSCKYMKFMTGIPSQFYSYIVRKTTAKDNKELALFDIVLFTEDGNIFGQLKDYCIKKVHEKEALSFIKQEKHNLYHQRSWTLYEENLIKEKMLTDEQVIWIAFDELNQKSVEISNRLGSQCTVVKAETDKDILDVMSNVREGKTRYIILDYSEKLLSRAVKMNEEVPKFVKNTFCVFKTLIESHARQNIQIILLFADAKWTCEQDFDQYAYWHLLKGMGKCLEAEHKNFVVRTIEANVSTKAIQIQSEIFSVWMHYSVLLYENKRYLEQLLPLSEEKKDKTVIEKDKAYMISGGLGGMGFAFAQQILTIAPTAKVALINRTYTEEEFLNAASNMNEEQRLKVDTFLQLKRSGANICIKKADVSDYESIKKAVLEVKNQYGTIFGVIHTAGVAGDGFLLNKNWDTFYNVLKPKVAGTLNLHVLTKQEPLDFFVMCSSYVTLYGAPGQSDYTAANAFLDGFASYRRSLGLPAVTINWTGWSESGMARNHEVDSSDMFVEFMDNTQGKRALVHALGAKATQVYAGKIRPDAMKLQLETYKGRILLSEEIANELEMEKQSVKTENRNLPKIDLSKLVISGKRIDKLTDTEKNIIAAWVETLKVSEVNVHDKFFETGGNSLLAAYLHKEIDKFYPGVLVITDIFVYSTIEEIAKFIESKLKDKEPPKDNTEESDLEDMVAKFMSGELNLEQLDAMIEI